MTRLECIKSNEFLLGLNMNKATKEQKIQWLCQIIDNETDKPEDEIDFALIGECSAYLRELSDKAAEATKEQKQRILQQIKAHHNQTATKSAKVLCPNWRKMGKIIAIAATVAAILLSTLTVLAKVNGYSSAWEYIRENAQKFLNMNAGDIVTNGNVTLMKGEESISYSSIEELLKTEGYDILYPTTLTEGVEITKVSHQIISEGYALYSIQFNNPILSVVISTQYSVSPEILEKCEKIEHPFLNAYLIKQADGVYQIIGFDEKYQYLICCYDYDLLIKILNGMRGIEK